MTTCEKKGPGYPTPLAAMSGPREKVAWMPCIAIKPGTPDYLATVDCDPHSPTYSTVISRLHMPHNNDELHHMGWNTCSSCYGDPSKVRDKLIVPALGSGRIYVVDISDPREPKLFKEIPASVLKSANLSAPHTTHCLPTGEVMISTMGDADGNAKGALATFNLSNFDYTGLWTEDTVDFGYDYWYQPLHDVLISTEWGAPKAYGRGFLPEDLKNGMYGTHLNVFSWSSKKLIQRIDLGEEGVMPLEIRFLHDPTATEGYVGSALYANVFRFYRDTDGVWKAHKVIDIPSKKVQGWALPDMPGVITDILISLDDRFLYFSNWVHGDVRQYDISDRRNPKLVGQLWLGGSICTDGSVKVLEDKELKKQPEPAFLKGKRITGGPQMLQLSLDGKRMYLTTSLFSSWDYQFYPDMKKKGSLMMLIDVDTDKGGLTLNQDFCVDFSNEPGGAVLAHEIRYPGGDCSSDIWLAEGQGCCAAKPQASL